MLSTHAPLGRLEATLISEPSLEHFRFLQRRTINIKARKILLPRLNLTEVVPENTPLAAKQSVLKETYFVRDLADAVTNKRFDDYPKWMGTKFNLFPVVLDANGAPWPEATVYIVAKLEDSVSPTMSTWSLIADDLAAFRRFLDENDRVEWTDFPENKLARPTYRYRAQLVLEIKAAQTALRALGRFECVW